MRLERWRGLTALTGTLALAGGTLAGSLSDGLQRQLRGLPGTDEVRVLVSLEDQVDVAALDSRLRVERASLSRRHLEVMSALQDKAATSQAPLLAMLAGLQEQGKVESFHPHWLVNAVVVRAQASVVPELALLPGVDQVEADLVPELITPARVGGDSGGGEREIGITPGVQAIQADRVWYELGITGQGAIVANMDTGVRRTHEALTARWRGNFAPASECWWDAYGTSTAPSDDNGHGSHVMGTITGVAPNDSIGVCPGALWIATNVIAGGTGTQFDNAVIAGLEWLSDPDGNAATVDEVPDVVQHSWGVNEGFGYQDCDSRWWNALDACEALGVCLTWSAGNEGPGSTTLRSPGDRATTATNAFSVGSVAYNAPYTISSFSSRGPSGCGGAFAIKPEVVAPGSNIYSVDASGNTGYTYMDGTSMAGPHVAGVVGLMRSANPDLDVATIKTILMETATPLGAAGEDNTYGWGLVNAYEAVLASMSGYGTVAGTVSGPEGQPLTGVQVSSTDGRSDFTDGLGQYAITAPAGELSLTTSFFGYQPASQAVTLVAGETTTADFQLTRVPSAEVSGVVLDLHDQPLAGALVSIQGEDMPAFAPITTGADGAFSFTLPVGQEVLVSSRGPAGETAAALGPDAYGYRAYDLDDGDADWAGAIAGESAPLVLQGKNRVEHEWELIDPETGGPGAALSFSDNDESHVVALPFTFRYYGQDYNQVTVCSNAWVALGERAETSYQNGPIPSTEGPGAMLAPAWEDYSPDLAESGNVSTWHDAAGGRFIVEYHHIRQFSPASAFESFQVVLLDPAVHPTVTGDGAIIFHYGEISNILSCTTGIESPDESTGLQYYLATGSAGTYGAGCMPITEDLSILFTTGMLPSTLLRPVDDLAIGLLPDLRPRLSWSPASGADGYRVERWTGAQWVVLGETTLTSWTDAAGAPLALYRVVALAQD